MDIHARINALDSVGKEFARDHKLRDLVSKTIRHNPWFTSDHYYFALKSISDKFLQKEALQAWLDPYEFEYKQPKRIGLVMAGNIPLVGFHDLLCVWMSGHKAVVKPSSKDPFVLPYICQKLSEIAPGFQKQTEFVEKLRDFDAVIATGSNNSARYFEYYFRDCPHIIRKNRVSVAVLRGDEKEDELLALGEDIFRYFGLGCRNVSALFVPDNYRLDHLMDLFTKYRAVRDHHKYKNNLDYHLTVQIMNKTDHLASDFLLMLKNPPSLASPIGALNIMEYKDDEMLSRQLEARKAQLQCIIGKGEGFIPFGQAQRPGLSDYADHIDTMKFLESV